MRGTLQTLAWLIQHARCEPFHRCRMWPPALGFTDLAMAPLVAEAIGVDVSAGMLDQARARA